MPDTRPRPLAGPPAPQLIAPIVAFLLLVVVLAYLVFRPFLLDLVVAASVTLLLWPVHKQLTSALRGRATLSAAILVLLTAVLILVPILSSLVFLGGQVGSFLTELRPRLQTAELRRLLEEALPERYPWLRPWLQAEDGGPMPIVSDLLSRLAAWTTSTVQGMLAGIGTALFDLTVFLLGLFFLLLDGAKLVKELRRISPFSDDQETQMLDHIARTVKAVLQAMIVVPLAQGILAGLGFALFGVPNPLTWGVIVVFAALVPVIGSPLGWVPAVVYLASTGPAGPAIGLGVYGLVVISGIDNVVKPLILRGSASIHPLIGFVAVLGGVLAFGPLGFLVGPLVISLVLSAIRIYRDDIVRVRPPGGGESIPPTPAPKL